MPVQSAKDFPFYIIVGHLCGQILSGNSQCREKICQGPVILYAKLFLHILG